MGKILGFIITGVIVLFFVAVSWRVAPLKKIVYGA